MARIEENLGKTKNKLRTIWQIIRADTFIVISPDTISMIGVRGALRNMFNAFLEQEHTCMVLGIEKGDSNNPFDMPDVLKNKPKFKD